MASVSKSIAGVLALDLDERDLIDLDQPTAAYIPGLPRAHAHTLGQTATMRAGIGHYVDHSTPDNPPYFTAQDAVEELWSVPPVRPIGQFGYSTHSWTYLAAGIEGALGDDIFDIFEEEWRGRYGLGSIRSEERDLYDPERSEIYNTDNSLIEDRDDLTWKVLGGGLEGSARDVARLFDRVQRGQVLGTAALEDFWTPVIGTTGYGYGVNRTNNWSCTSRVGKSGGWTGANSFLLMYPELKVTIVVLTNRRYGGHNAGQIADTIGSYIRSTECP